MSEIWEYLLAAAEKITGDLRDAQMFARDEQPFAEPLVFWLNRTASDAAHDFAKMVELGIQPHVARITVQLSADTMVGIAAAEEAIGVNYETWSKQQGSSDGYANAFV